MGKSSPGGGGTLGLGLPHLVPVCRGNVIVLCPEVGCGHDEIRSERLREEGRQTIGENQRKKIPGL